METPRAQAEMDAEVGLKSAHRGAADEQAANFVADAVKSAAEARLLIAQAQEGQLVPGCTQTSRQLS